MNASLTVIAHIRAKAGQESRVRQILQGLLSPTRAEVGCINYDLHRSQGDPAVFVFYENWESEGHLESACAIRAHSILSKTGRRDSC